MTWRYPFFAFASPHYQKSKNLDLMVGFLERTSKPGAFPYFAHPTSI
jgi:hypothetical protein